MIAIWVRAGVALAALLASATFAAAEDWIPSASSSSASYFMDLSTFARKGDVVQSWMREDLVHPSRASSGASFNRTLTQRYDDCVVRKFAFGEAVRRNDKGETVETVRQPGGWREIAPGSVAESVWRVACAASEPPKEKPLLEDISAPAWTDLGPSSDKKYVMYAALDGVVRLDADHVLMLTRSDFMKAEWIEGLPIRHMIAASVIDCAARKTATAGADLFMSPSVRVRAVRAASQTDLKFQAPAPGSFAFINLDRICSSAAASADDKDAGDIATGTAWMVAKGYLVTADHVVAGAKTLTLFSNGEAVGKAVVVSEDAANDLAILKPAGWAPGRRAALPLAAHGVALGRRVFTLGYPEPETLGQKIKMTAGDVSGTTGPRDDAHDLQISIPIQPGNSGGPVLTWEGTVVGIVDSKLTEFAAGEADPKPELVNYAVKAAYLRPMLDELPDLGGYVILEAKGGPDQIVAQARKSVFMVVAEH
jgi:S1-C subfamily serine protease